ncbi:hypothetical protein [Peribacillus frigoritolerans]|uniref:Uncharacterized protein n=1 Tax=Peribacillus castrilensis TaxID=2897690 RepID=A0AAW9NGF2_9BACI|nr:hypothetical protein [Peribacillus castrilensis]
MKYAKTDIVNFNDGKFLEDLGRNLKRATQEITNMIEDHVKTNARALPFRTSLVGLNNGGAKELTSDAERAMALFSSITKERVEWLGANINRSLAQSLPKKYKATERGTLVGRVNAMGDENYKDSHIGIYYEYGTGPGMDLSSFNDMPISLGDENPHRPLRSTGPIVTRGTNTNGGVWYDAGGNRRISKGKGGLRSAVFAKQVGDGVQAEHWFREGYQAVLPKAKVLLKEAVSSLDLKDYLEIPNPKINLGGKAKRRG